MPSWLSPRGGKGLMRPGADDALVVARDDGYGRTSTDGTRGSNRLPALTGVDSRTLHRRSISNPIPTQFDRSKPRQNSAAGIGVEAGPSNQSKRPMEIKRTTAGQTSSNNNKDFVSGHCMTCNSLVRWPRNLDIFKCTICLTVNDLSPRQNNQRQGSENQSYAPVAISLQQTKRIIKNCLHSYMVQKFNVGPQRDAGSAQLPPNHLAQFNFQFQDLSSLQLDEPRPNTLSSRSYSSSHDQRPQLYHQRLGVGDCALKIEPKRIFKELEDYIIASSRTIDTLNASFRRQGTPGPASVSTNGQFAIPRKPVTTSSTQRTTDNKGTGQPQSQDVHFSDLDPRLLMLGDVAENSMWWINDGERAWQEQNRDTATDERSSPPLKKTSRFHEVHWENLAEWYSMVTKAGATWVSAFEEVSNLPGFSPPSDHQVAVLERDILVAQEHVQGCLLKWTENLLKRPGKPLRHPEDMHFLIILLENPLLHSNHKFRNASGDKRPLPGKESSNRETASSGPLSGQHSGIIKRIIGLISNSPPECHQRLTSWLSRCEWHRFVRIKDFTSSFLTYRLLRHQEKKQNLKPGKVDFTGDLVPEMQIGRNGNYIHDELSVLRPTKKTQTQTKLITYAEDWQVNAAAKVLAIIFAANENTHHRASSRKRRGLPASDFYVSMVDYVDLHADFEAWETKKSSFSFCQYPFLMSIWAKIQILGHETRRQMQLKARDALLDNILSNKNVNQYLLLDVRRDCLVEDSLGAVSQVLGSGSDDLKKGLRITFVGEDGIDGGGLRKEWFLLLVREVFHPDHGLFLYDEDSKYCYFNPNTFETSDQFFLVGVVVGLAIYNSTILDVPLPPFTFRKLLTSAPLYSGVQLSQAARNMKYTLEHLAEYQPRVARGLQQLLDYNGDVESVFSLDFVIETDKYGYKIPIPLCAGGDKKPVTNSNRREYVDLYVRYVLETSVHRQYEAFKRGFYTVCGGNAFSLFRPEEIELLVRGSDEPLDVAALRAVAVYDNWGTKQPDGSEPVIDWFWESLQQAGPNDQRRLLLFVTGSDRLPATGASALSIKISCLGDNQDRFPIARTCFNQLSLWRYDSKEKLEYMVWRAVHESEGFGLK
ncbi:hypothetical protein VHEMI00679 [[Torrubiella] hemipterigena]|uniref:HECT-type E3 ubiquitin transferase n=1 Tax=[Torrubiella] hemipterigena TaxID=1531966 RepID=A0A0A1T585_9HYPO|nr:hypothetical protein VHEMI00679 [[Torrubiella] hemipterigena]